MYTSPPGRHPMTKASMGLWLAQLCLLSRSSWTPQLNLLFMYPLLTERPPRRQDQDLQEDLLPPPVRIDTCIVGNDNTCKVKHHEICKTYLGVSSCYCKPGYGRKNHRLLCKSKTHLACAKDLLLFIIEIVRLLMSMKIDRIQEEKIVWNNEYDSQNTEMYQVLEGEVNYAVSRSIEFRHAPRLYVLVFRLVLPWLSRPSPMCTWGTKLINSSP